MVPILKGWNVQGRLKCWEITYMNVSSGDETYGEVTYGDVLSLYKFANDVCWPGSLRLFCSSVHRSVSLVFENSSVCVFVYSTVYLSASFLLNVCLTAFLPVDSIDFSVLTSLYARMQVCLFIYIFVSLSAHISLSDCLSFRVPNDMFLCLPIYLSFY